jgi:hypothetical protein
VKKKQRTIAPVPRLNPEWLLTDPEGPDPGPPVRPKARVLPFLEQHWRDFERLCRCLAECGGTVEDAQAYGTAGQAQLGTAGPLCKARIRTYIESFRYMSLPHFRLMHVPRMSARTLRAERSGAGFYWHTAGLF